MGATYSYSASFVAKQVGEVKLKTIILKEATTLLWCTNHAHEITKL